MIVNGLSIRNWDIAFAIYVTTGLLMDVALVYCSMAGSKNNAFCKEVLEMRYLAESVDCINAILDGCGHWLLIKPIVLDWVNEHKLSQWITMMNASVGVAPSYQCVFERYVSLSMHRDNLKSLYRTPDVRRKWVQRFMKRWKSSRGNVCCHEAENVNAVVTKVHTIVDRTRVFLGFGVPVLGPFLVLKIGLPDVLCCCDRSTKRPRNWNT